MSSIKTLRCPACDLDRDLGSFALTHKPETGAVCDFCQESGHHTPTPTQKIEPEPSPAPRKRGPKPKEKLKVEEKAPEPERIKERSPEIQAEADAAFAMPYTPPTFDKMLA